MEGQEYNNLTRFDQNAHILVFKSMDKTAL